MRSKVTPICNICRPAGQSNFTALRKTDAKPSNCWRCKAGELYGPPQNRTGPNINPSQTNVVTRELSCRKQAVKNTNYKQ